MILILNYCFAICNTSSRLGQKVREYQAQIDQMDHEHKNKPRTTKAKRPHIRRGHWHGYWYGSDQSKEFKVKWLPAVFVNG